MKTSGCIRNGRAFLSLVLFFLLFAPCAFAEAGISILPDKSIFIQVINFLFLMIVLNIIVYRPIRNVLIRRKEKFDGLEQSIHQNNDEALEKGNAFNAGISEARAKGAKEKTALLEAASEEEKRIIEEINKKAQANLVEVREKILKDTDNVKASLQKEIDGFADAIGEKILGRAV